MKLALIPAPEMIRIIDPEEGLAGVSVLLDEAIAFARSRVRMTASGLSILVLDCVNRFFDV